MSIDSALRRITRTHLACWVLAFMVPLLYGSTALAAPREVRVGVYQNEPKIFMGENNQPTGILGDLLVEMAQHEAWTLRTVPCEWQACLEALQAGEIDLMPDVAYTEQRSKQLDFHTTPALLSWSQLYKHSGVQINSALDLKGKRIAVLAGSVQQDYLQNLLNGFGLKAELVPVQSLKEGFEKVAARTVDAAAANRFYGDLQAAQYQLDPTPILFQPAQLFYATSKGHNADLLSAIDQRLGPWQSQPDSHYFVILKRWMEAPAPATVPAYVRWSLAGLALLLFVAVTVVLVLRRQVADKSWHLQSTEDRLATILNSVDAYIYIKDAELRYQYVNRKVADLFGVLPSQVVGKTDSDFFDAATVTKLHINDLRVVEHGERVEEEETNRSADGTFSHTYLSVKLPLRRRDGSVYALCGISTDITKHKQAEAAIHQLAFYDPLTQLPNRRLLMERLGQAIAAQTRDKQCCALLFIDVDNFKDLNDTLGHHTGDQLLRQIAHRLLACIRAQDTLARQGGDEFVVMLQGLSFQLDDAAQQARQVAQKILQTLAEPYLLVEHQYLSTVSIGIAMFSGALTDQDELLKQADLAMYQAKTDGRNTVRFFNPEMQAQVSERTALEADLHHALVASEFLLYYQPQINSAGQQLGVEALVRWQHPQRGLVSPAEFIPVAEVSGLILPLGQWILTTACHQLVAWSRVEEKQHWSIAVNISARQFRQPDFVQQVLLALQVSGADPQYLKLELTESQLIEDVESVVAKMDALKARGVRFSLDDFGTGYSSLSILKRLPLDQLKIDQSFVRDVLTDPQDASIVRAIVTLGTSLDLQVIAEGVETPEQRAALLELGCQNFQGYLFGRPAPA
jgi:diguanylate cyclase (GGDEF)-like protein/PAS domain S-box-containing protein